MSTIEQHERLATLPVTALEQAVWQTSHEAGCMAKDTLCWYVCLTGDENMECAVNEAAQDDQQNDQAGESSSGIARRLTIIDGDVGVSCVASGNYVDLSCAPRA
jgi:hypothetical protein